MSLTSHGFLAPFLSFFVLGSVFEIFFLESCRLYWCPQCSIKSTHFEDGVSSRCVLFSFKTISVE